MARKDSETKRHRERERGRETGTQGESERVRFVLFLSPFLFCQFRRRGDTLIAHAMGVKRLSTTGVVGNAVASDGVRQLE